MPPVAPAPHIDWHAQTGDAARDYVRQRERSERQRSRFAPHEPFDKLESKEKLDAGWNEHRFNRVESHPGATVSHLNERCSMVVSGLILPVCTLGKIKPSGEMHERMKEWERERNEYLPDDVP